MLCCSPHYLDYLARFHFNRLELHLHLSPCHHLPRWHFPCLLPQKKRGSRRKWWEEMGRARVRGENARRRFAGEGLNSWMVRREKRGGRRKISPPRNHQPSLMGRRTTLPLSGICVCEEEKNGPDFLKSSPQPQNSDSAGRGRLRKEKSELQ